MVKDEPDLLIRTSNEV